MESDMRHSTRGGMLPIRHERILKPERPDGSLNNRNRMAGGGENKTIHFPSDAGFFGRDEEKKFNPED